MRQILARWCGPLALVLALFLMAGPALAADPKGDAHGEDPGLLALTWDLGLWSIVIFVGLLLILRKAAWGPILEGLQKREESIRGSVEEAKRTRAEMEQIRAQFQAELAAAHAQIPRLMDEARANAQRMADELRVKATEDIQAERQRTRRELDIARDQALQELRDHAAQLATLISAKAIGRSISEDDHRRLIDEALTEINNHQGAGAR
jgi:F-type H+-transporting ATPase subunit b